MSEYTICSRCNEKPAAICISCLTDCTDLNQQPTEGEHAKRLRNFVKMYETEVPIRAEITFLKEACDIIDRAESINKDLLEVCECLVSAEETFSETNETIVKFGGKVLGIIIPKAKSAIAKAKQ